MRCVTAVAGWSWSGLFVSLAAGCGTRDQASSISGDTAPVSYLPSDIDCQRYTIYIIRLLETICMYMSNFFTRCFGDIVIIEPHSSSIAQ